MMITYPITIVVGIEIRFNVLNLDYTGHVNAQILDGSGAEPLRYEFNANTIAAVFNLILAWLGATALAKGAPLLNE